ncbi:MAG: FHA domain-containing protein, partial [Planctomycetes bacterium]|nr:FHA domain-containing protein [Planctomycetota bacterium]
MATDKSDTGGAAPSRRPMTVTSSAARAHLEATAGPEKGQTFRVAPGATVLGRDASCEVALSETAISRQHARIERRGEAWVFVNLSANGSQLNKKPVEEAELADGDEIRIGAKTRLVFVVEEVIPVAGGRPQFRARATAKDEAEESAEAAEAEEAKPSLFRRGRKSIFIVVAAAVPTLLFMGAIVYQIVSPARTTTGRAEIPI